MKRPFSFLDSGYLLHQFAGWQDEINALAVRSDSLRGAIREAAEHCIAAEVMAVLREIPVEEVNRDRHGIRIKVMDLLAEKQEIDRINQEREAQPLRQTS